MLLLPSYITYKMYLSSNKIECSSKSKCYWTLCKSLHVWNNRLHYIKPHWKIADVWTRSLLHYWQELIHIVGKFITHRLVPPSILSVIKHLYCPRLISLLWPLLGWLAPQTRLPLCFLMLLQHLLLLPRGLMIMMLMICVSICLIY